MATRYTIEFLPAAARQLKALPRGVQRRVADMVDALAMEPRPTDAKLLSATGGERIWRVPVDDYRILYQVLDDRVVVVIVRMADRREVYNPTAMRRLLAQVRHGSGR